MVMRDLILLGLAGMDGNARPNTARTDRDGCSCVVMDGFFNKGFH